MDTRIPSFLLISATLAMVVLACGCSPQNSSAQTQTAAPSVTTTNTLAEAPQTPAPSVPVTPETVSSATAAPLPSNILPTSQLAQVIRLTQAGVDQSIVMTFVTNSSRTFNLDSDKIIYLTDTGATADLVTAMMQRDQQLQDQFAAAHAAQQAQTVQPDPTTEPPPADTTDTNLAPAPEPPVTVNYFYNTLSPYGSWVYVAGYGNCWRPTVCAYNPGWRPYCDRGSWVYSDCGWYWNSDYAWGVTFHYGRWFQNPAIGWCWYPDTVWAPSWVTWRQSNNYCGWAPLPPGTACQPGVGIVYHGNNISVGAVSVWAQAVSLLCQPQYFLQSAPAHHYCASPAQVTQIYNNTTVINNFNVNNHTIVNHGIDVGRIAAGTHTPIHPIPVHDLNVGAMHGGSGEGQSMWSTCLSSGTGSRRGPLRFVRQLHSPRRRRFNPTPIHYSQPGQNWPAQAARCSNITLSSRPFRNGRCPWSTLRCLPKTHPHNPQPKISIPARKLRDRSGSRPGKREPRLAAYNYGSRQRCPRPNMLSHHKIPHPPVRRQGAIVARRQSWREPGLVGALRSPIYFKTPRANFRAGFFTVATLPALAKSPRGNFPAAI